MTDYGLATGLDDAGAVHLDIKKGSGHAQDAGEIELHGAINLLPLL